MRKWIVLLLATAVALFFAACEAANRTDSGSGSDADGDADSDSDSDSDGDTDADSDSDGDTSAYGGCEMMDILFVVDDSGSMTEEQANLTANFPQFVTTLNEYITPAGTPLEYRLGVTTTGVTRTFTQKIPFYPPLPMSTSGPDGELQGQSACDLGAVPWVEGDDPDVISKFSCMASVGTGGSGTEMPFAAVGHALLTQSQPGEPNEGFYRVTEDSLLVVVIITDEDDCSIENGGTMNLSLAGGADCNQDTSTGLLYPQDVKDFLDTLTGAEGRYVVVGIAGSGGPTCAQTDLGSAINAARIQELVELCGDYGVFGDICEGDLWVSLANALDVMAITCDEFPPID